MDGHVVLAGADVEVPVAAAADLLAGEDADAGVERPHRQPLARVHEGRATRHLVMGDAGEVHGHARPRADRVDSLLQALQAADARGLARQQLHGVAGRQAAAGQRAGDDGAGAADRERAVDPETGPAGVRLRGRR